MSRTRKDHHPGKERLSRNARKRLRLRMERKMGRMTTPFHYPHHD